MAKLLLQPLFLLLLIAMACLLVCMSTKSSSEKGFKRTKVPQGLALAALLLLCMLSLPIATNFLERTLQINSSASSAPPDVIVVLGGGYLRGATSGLDLLVPETANRVLTGVLWWRRVRHASLIMSSRSVRETQLMSELAMGAGVLAGKLRVETQSMSTWDHPERIRAMTGITGKTRIGLVTSPWHNRRAMWSFKRFFRMVILPPVPSGFAQGEALSMAYWIPNPDSLSRSTTMLHEWIGLAWYRVLQWMRG